MILIIICESIETLFLKRDNIDINYQKILDAPVRVQIRGILCFIHGSSVFPLLLKFTLLNIAYFIHTLNIKFDYL